MPPTSSSPSSILIIGSGIFGLTTAHALTQRPSHTHTTITLLDRSPFPSPDGASIDTSRIIRADYSDPAYAALAAAAQTHWRARSGNPTSDLGGEGRYTESGLVLVADRGAQGEAYVQASYENVRRMQGGAEGVVDALKDRGAIEGAVGTGGGSGDTGYVNRASGWADAEGGMRWLRRQVEATGRVKFVHAEVAALKRKGRKVTGVRLVDGNTMIADLVVVAAGAWSGALVDLRGIATASGQVLAYLDITAEEQEQLGKMPVLLNMSSGLFIIPPANRVLKVARHAFGYSNPTQIQDPNGTGQQIEVSLPRTVRDDPGLWIPREGEEDCRRALREMIPALGERPFVRSKICWYTDTVSGDFLITYHPDFDGLFMATGGSGHGYKFLPVIGEKIVDCIDGDCPEEFKEKWAWPEKISGDVATHDGSRGGVPGLILENEMRKGCKI